MDCEKYLELMSAVLDGECTAEERRALDDHLAVCPECAEWFRILSANAAAARELDCEMPADLKSRIMNSLPAQEKPAKQGKVIHWKRWAPVAAAACLVLVVSLLPMGARNDNSASAPMTMESISSSDGSGGTQFAATGDAPADAADLMLGGLCNETDQTSYGCISTVENTEPDSCTFENQQLVRIPSRYRPELPEPGAQIIGSAAEMEAYLAQMAQYDLDGNLISESEAWLETLRDHYAADDRFYETNRLLCILIHTRNGGDQFRIVPQGLQSGSVAVEQTMFGATYGREHFLLVAEVGLEFDPGDQLDTMITWIDRTDLRKIDNVHYWHLGSLGQSDDAATVIHSMEELQTYLARYPHWADPTPEDITAAYTDEFFQSNTLVAITNAEAVTHLKQIPVLVNDSRVYLYRDDAPYGATHSSVWLTLIEVGEVMETDGPLELVTAYLPLREIMTAYSYPDLSE